MRMYVDSDLPASNLNWEPWRATDYTWSSKLGVEKATVTLGSRARAAAGAVREGRPGPGLARAAMATVTQAWPGRSRQGPARNNWAENGTRTKRLENCDVAMRQTWKSGNWILCLRRRGRPVPRQLSVTVKFEEIPLFNQRVGAELLRGIAPFATLERFVVYCSTESWAAPPVRGPI